MYAEKTIKRLRDSDSIVIYGAGRIARTVYYCMIREPYSLKIDSFLVSDMEGNDDRGCAGHCSGGMERSLFSCVDCSDGWLFGTDTRDVGFTGISECSEHDI